MKKILLSICCTMCLLACADEKKVIDFAALPQPAQAILNAHIQPNNILLITQEGNAYWAEYEVRLTDYSEWEFNGQGSLKDVKMTAGVPNDLVPQPILTCVAQRFPNVLIVEYNRDSNDQEVKLNNGVELKFDLQGRLLDVDLD